MAGYVLEYMSKSEKETLNIGEKLGRLITKKNENNLVVLLKGDLGAGKTLFVKGMARGLNIETKISSPTYNLINEYKGETPLFHMDLYRINDEKELIFIGFEEYLTEREGVVAIEWPEIAIKFLPDDRMDIDISVISSTKRKIKIEAGGKFSGELWKELKDYAGFRNR